MRTENLKIKDEIRFALLKSRDDAGYTQREMAKLISVNEKTINNWECGRTDLKFIDGVRWFQALEKDYRDYLNIDYFSWAQKSTSKENTFFSEKEKSNIRKMALDCKLKEMREKSKSLHNPKLNRILAYLEKLKEFLLS